MIVIDVEGLIGAGKTTLIGHLKAHYELKGFKVIIIKENVDNWSDILPLFYADPKRWAYHFQTKVFLDRVNESINQFKEPADIYITERGVISDRIFMKVLYQQKNITDMEWKDYNQWCGLWEKVMPFKPDVYLYLTPSMNEVMKRVRKRNRNGEDTVSIEYQQLLKSEHDETFLKVDNYSCSNNYHTQLDTYKIPVVKIESDGDFNDKSVLNSIINSLSTIIFLL